MKLCVDCKWCQVVERTETTGLFRKTHHTWTEHVCRGVKDPVTGERFSRLCVQERRVEYAWYIDEFAERHRPGACQPEGKLWEPKEGADDA